MADPIFGTPAASTSSSGNTTTQTSRTLASTVVGNLNLIPIEASPLANVTDPGLPKIDNVAISATIGSVTSNGWVTVFSVWDTGSPGPRLTVVGKVYAAGDPTSVTISWASAGNHAAGAVSVAAGLFDASTATSWLDAADAQAQSASSTDFPTPSLVVPHRSRLVAVYGNRTGGGPWTSLNGGTLVTSGQSASSANFGLFDEGMVDPGTYSRTGHWTAATSVGIAGIFAIRASDVAPLAGTASLTGSGTLTASGVATSPGAVNLNGAGTLTATGKPASSAAVNLSGSGTLTGSTLTPVQQWLNDQPFYCAHRGGSKDWVEHTMNAYDQSVAWGVKALEASVWKSADGTWWCSHDRSTGLVRGDGSTWCSTDVDIPNSTDAQIAAVRTNVGNYPLITLGQLLTKYGQSRIIFVDNKQNLNVTAFCDYLQSFANATARFVVKAYITATTTAAEWKARGGHTWAYAYASNVDAGEVNSTTVAPFTILGMDYNANQSYHDTLAAYGRYRMGHIIDSPTAKTTALNYGDQGMMASKITTVVPQTGATGNANLTGSGTLSATPGPVATGGSANTSGTGSLTATAKPTLSGAASMSGSGTLSATGTPTGVGVVTLTGAGNLDGTGRASSSATVQLAGTGTLSAVATPALGGTAVTSGVGSLTASGTPNGTGAASLSGVGTLTASGDGVSPGAVALTGEGNLTTMVTPNLRGAATFTGTGTLTGQVINLAIRAAALLTGRGDLTATGSNTTPPDPTEPIIRATSRLRLRTRNTIVRFNSHRGDLR